MHQKICLIAIVYVSTMSLVLKMCFIENDRRLNASDVPITTALNKYDLCFFRKVHVTHIYVYIYINLYIYIKSIQLFAVDYL